jgi:uncharacterized protein (DUF1778 family)
MEAAIKGRKTVQLNVRIDANLKSTAEFAMKTHGLTPSELVRSVYQLFAMDQDAAEKLMALLDTPESGASANPKVLATRRFERQMEQFATEFGPLAFPESCSDDELLTEALLSRLEEKGLV